MNSSDNKSQTFEEQLATLEQLTDRMENGNLSLEATLEAYEKGMALVRALSMQLEQAEKKIAQISGEQVIPMEEESNESQDLL